MLSNPKYGWADFKYGNFEQSVSYITDAPRDLLDCIIAQLKESWRPAGVTFDTEGSMFYLIITSGETFVVDEGDGEEYKVIRTDPWRDNVDIAEEIYDDISSNIDGWIEEFLEWPDTDGLIRKDMESKLAELKALIEEKKRIYNMMPEVGNLFWGHSRGAYRVDRDDSEKLFAQFLKDIGCDAYGYAKDDVAKKYVNNLNGITTDKFTVRPYYWGDDEELMKLPNFEYKPSDFSIMWYKYPMRDSYSNREYTIEEFKQILEDCRASMPKG